MNRFEITSKPLTWLMALVLTAVVAGCGGGGGGGTAPMTSVDGIGAFGKPIIGGSAQMVCANNAAGTAITTAATGAFTVTAPGSAPCVIRISGGNLVGGPFYSIFAAGQTRANVNQLTTMLAFLLADGNPETFFTSPSTISTKITAAAVATDQETVRASVIANLAGAVTPAISTSFDFLQTPFTANSTGFDQMLDKLGFASVGNTSASITFNGAPILAVNPTTNVASTTSSTLITSVTLAAAGASGTAGIPGTVLPGVAGTTGAAATNPTAISANPSNGATNVPTSINTTGTTVVGKSVIATFSAAMLPATITAPGTFTLKEMIAGTNVPGTVIMNGANTIATFTPSAAALLANTQYTATVSTAAQNAAGTAIPTTIAWSFTTNAVLLTAQAPVNLGAAGNFVAFGGTGVDQAVSLVPAAITGDIGVSQTVTSTAITGFGLILPPAGAFSTSAEITGRAFARDYAAPTPAFVTTAAADMISAYNDAAGRTAGVGAFLNRNGGNLGGLTLVPGVYTWGTAVTLPAGTNLTLSGGPNDVWIFQIAGTLTTAATSSVNLIGGALPKNIFWQVAGTSATVGAAPAHFEGIILAQVAINFGNRASANTRLLAQAAVNLSQNALTPPAP